MQCSRSRWSSPGVFGSCFASLGHSTSSLRWGCQRGMLIGCPLLGEIAFVFTTLNKNENVSVLLLRCEKTSNDYVFSKLLYETLEISSTQPVSSPYFGIDNLVKFDIVGSSNGLVCLLGLFPLNIAVWNPATKEAKVVPESHISNPQGGAQIRDLGFGLEVKTTEYKVVKILEIYDRNPKLTYYDLEFFYEAEIYCLSIDSWRKG
nr:hypothetical protein CFP56_28076 [Quercus suber]